MSNVALIAVILRLAGIWVVWLRGFHIANFLTWSGSGFEPAQHVLFLAENSGSLIIGLLVLIWPMPVARLLTPHTLRRDDGPASWLPADFGAVALGVTGLIFVATTLGSSSTWNVVFISFDVSGAAFRAVHADEVLGIIVRLVIGIGLVWGAGGLSRILAFGRRARLDNELSKEDT